MHVALYVNALCGVTGVSGIGPLVFRNQPADVLKISTIMRNGPWQSLTVETY